MRLNPWRCGTTAEFSAGRCLALAGPFCKCKACPYCAPGALLAGHSHGKSTPAVGAAVAVAEAGKPAVTHVHAHVAHVATQKGKAPSQPACSSGLAGDTSEEGCAAFCKADDPNKAANHWWRSGSDVGLPRTRPQVAPLARGHARATLRATLRARSGSRPGVPSCPMPHALSLAPPPPPPLPAAAASASAASAAPAPHCLARARPPLPLLRRARRARPLRRQSSCACRARVRRPATSATGRAHPSARRARA
jgi:hypothetical protein